MQRIIIILASLITAAGPIAAQSARDGRPRDFVLEADHWKASCEAPERTAPLCATGSQSTPWREPFGDGAWARAEGSMEGCAVTLGRFRASGGGRVQTTPCSTSDAGDTVCTVTCGSGTCLGVHTVFARIRMRYKVFAQYFGGGSGNAHVTCNTGMITTTTGLKIIATTDGNSSSAANTTVNSWSFSITAGVFSWTINPGGGSTSAGAQYNQTRADMDMRTAPGTSERAHGNTSWSLSGGASGRGKAEAYIRKWEGLMEVRGWCEYGTAHACWFR